MRSLYGHGGLLSVSAHSNCAFQGRKVASRRWRPCVIFWRSACRSIPSGASACGCALRGLHSCRECMYCKRERVIKINILTITVRTAVDNLVRARVSLPHAIRASLSAHVQDGACGEVAHIGRAVANVCKEQGHAARLDEPRPGHLLVGEHAEGGGHVRLKLGLL